MASLKVFQKRMSSLAIRISFTTSKPPFCNYVLRNFTIGKPSKSSSKRKIQTSTGWFQHEFNIEPPPKLVSGIPNMATTEIITRRNDSRPSTQVDQYDHSTGALRPEEQPSKYIKESEKQSLNTNNTSATPEAKPRLKLRARKAAIKLTPGAVNHLRKLLGQPTPKLIKIGVRNRGCSGLAYHLEYVNKAGLLDEEVEQDGVKVIIDSKALFSIIGSEMDWVEDKLQQKFVFKNPNIKEQCGCGESFMV
ncbi:putative iron sulfur assembly protein 1 [Erysiphe necator]|uniref:Iron-sulfur assembly protein 1 n=1 Tax=Uncinula necator TaxID=52586 RepID=A0A0B1P6R8_UNCNE|nr:putative iron sulfur assembly protein 1 [Erysiphe necator]